jgi:hypothetical protein
MLALSAPYAASAKQAPNHGQSSKSKAAALRGASHTQSGRSAFRLTVPKIIRVAPGSATAVADTGTTYCSASICADPQCDVEGVDCDAFSASTQADTAGVPDGNNVEDCLLYMSGCTGQQYCQMWGFSYCEVWGFNTDLAAPAPAGDASRSANQG